MDAQGCAGYYEGEVRWVAVRFGLCRMKSRRMNSLVEKAGLPVAS